MTTIPETLATGLQLHRAGDLPHAEAAYQQILQQDPNHTEALHWLGVIAHQRGDFAQAVKLISKSVNRNSEDAIACYDLGEAYRAQGNLKLAAKHYAQALKLRPDFAEAYNSQGSVLAAQENWQAAVESYEQALRLRPRLAEPYYNLGNALASLNRLSEAVSYYQQAIRLKPELVQAHYNLGTALQALDQSEAAVASYRKALELRPSYPEALNNLGNALRDLGQVSAAIESYDQAILINPAYAEAHWNRSTALLLSGDYQAGFPAYEWRWQLKDRVPSALPPEKCWNGSDPLTGRRILLQTEQGFGDALQFSRYIPLVIEQGAEVILECQPKLAALFSGVSGIQQVIAKGEQRPEFDLHASLLSLPALLGTSLETIPNPIADWHLPPSEPLPDPRFKIGIVWASGFPERSDQIKLYQRKSCSLNSMLDLLEIPEIRLYSLQVGRDAEGIRFVAQERVHDLGSQFQDFSDTAAAIAQLDLVITVDTAVTHLAGSLMKPVWLLLPFAADWRWLLEREDSPWYPTLKLFRQPDPGNWTAVFERVKTELRAWIGSGD